MGKLGKGKGEGKGKGKGKKKDEEDDDEEEEEVDVCAYCGTTRSEDHPLAKCKKCKLVWYCAEGGCQRVAWTGGHREVCKAQEEQAATDPEEELLRSHAPADFKCPIRYQLLQL